MDLCQFGMQRSISLARLGFQIVFTMWFCYIWGESTTSWEGSCLMTPKGPQRQCFLFCFFNINLLCSNHQTPLSLKKTTNNLLAPWLFIIPTFVSPVPHWKALVLHTFGPKQHSVARFVTVRLTIMLWQNEKSKKKEIGTFVNGGKKQNRISSTTKQS